MVDMVLQDPFVISNIFDDIYFNALQKYAMNLWANDDGSAFSEGFGRYQWANTEILNEGSELLLPMAKEKFKSNTLKPSWNLLVTYQTEKAKLWKHLCWYEWRIFWICIQFMVLQLCFGCY